MQYWLLATTFLFNSLALSIPVDGPAVIDEYVYVETPLDTDQDGKLDKIYVKVSRPNGEQNLPTILRISPYALGGNNTPNHSVDVDTLPQDDMPLSVTRFGFGKTSYLPHKGVAASISEQALANGYASLEAHSLGTGNSTGCPTVGDKSEALATKAIIDWLNGKARAFSANGRDVAASWASGAVGMTGVSYDGSLPNMVATTGVEGLKAIIPVAAVSNWYDYYRANGLVVGPGGYIGEDADVLGKYIVRSGACKNEINLIAKTMGREHGDFTQFWQDRDYVSKAADVQAAVFIIHGQSDWNVKQRHAIQWWEALKGHVPLRLWLHKSGHALPSRSDLQVHMWAWFDRYVKGIENGIENRPPVEVENPDGTWVRQQEWPSETTTTQTLYLNPNHSLSGIAGDAKSEAFTDAGKTLRLESLVDKPDQAHESRLAFTSPALIKPKLMSGTPEVQLNLAVLNRKAANLTVAIVEYSQNGRSKVVTRGWADPQNHADIRQGELLIPSQEYQVNFSLEPKQYTFAKGSRIGVIVTATDYDYTIRPKAGTKVAVSLGQKSFVKMNLSGD